MYLFLVALFLHRIPYCLNVYPVLICDPWERVEWLLCLALSLFVPEYVVDPAVDILADILWLECLPHVYDEQVWIVHAPGRQFHIIHYLSILLLPEVDPVPVDEELGAVEELWDELSHVRMVSERRADWVVQRVEASVWRVQLLSMELH